MKSQELYSTLREQLPPVFSTNGFKRAKTMLSWVRPHGELYIGVWCQADQRGWDTYAGSRFVVEFQLGYEPLIAWKTICRQRIARMFSAAEREAVRSIQNNVIAALHRPPKSYALLNVCEEVSLIYLQKLNSIDQPYSEREDIWFRYASREDVERWAKFLVGKLPDCFRQVEMWDGRTPSE